MASLAAPAARVCEMSSAAAGAPLHLHPRQRVSLRPMHHHHSGSRLRAGPPAAAEWAALARADGGDAGDAAVDQDLAAAINDVCTRAARAMLGADPAAVRALRDELDGTGAACAAAGDVEAATFVFVVLSMLRGTLPRQMVALRGPYLRAFEKLYSLVEDSGWELERDEGARAAEGGGGGGGGGPGPAGAGA